MTDPLTASVLVTLAIQEFIKSGTGDLAKRFTAEAVAKIPVLWRKENRSRSMKHWRFFVTWYGSIGGHKSTKSLSGKRLN